MKPGQKVTLEVWRDGKEKTLTATVGELSDRNDVADARRGDAASQGKLGVAVRALTAEERQSADVANGVVVEDVAGAAARAGVPAPRAADPP